MTHPTVTLPLYVLDDADLQNLIDKCLDISTEVEAPELQVPMAALVKELKARGNTTYRLGDDGTTIIRETNKGSRS